MNVKDIRTLLEKAGNAFGFSDERIIRVDENEYGRNLVFEIGDDAFLRISGLGDRTLSDYIAETDFVRYLAKGGASVADVIPSKSGRLVEEIDGFAVSMFRRAKGDSLSDHDYEYREGVSIKEYFYNTGMTLGKIHALSKEYEPRVKRFDLFDKYNEVYFETLVPDELEFMGDRIGRRLKDRFHEILDKLRKKEKTDDNYGIVHFDYNDGNYHIEYDTGKINVFDFDNCRTCWYLFDIACVWSNGLGWTAWREEPDERRAFMDRYMETVMDGYRSQCHISDKEMDDLELFVDLTLMECVVDVLEVKKRKGEAFTFNEEQNYNLKCLLDGIHWFGFYDDIFDTDHPFEYFGNNA